MTTRLLALSVYPPWWEVCFCSCRLECAFDKVGMEVHPGLLFFCLQPTGVKLLLELDGICNEAV